MVYRDVMFAVEREREEEDEEEEREVRSDFVSGGVFLALSPSP